MSYTMNVDEPKEASETYRLIPHKVNDVTFYILEIDSWCHACVLIMNSKKDAEKLIKRDNKYTHLIETDEWVCSKLVKLMVTMLDNPFENHIASHISDRDTFFNMLDKAM